MMWRGPLWQYPAKTQPVREVALPTLDWLVQHPEPPLPLPLPQQPPALVLQGEPIIPSCDWFVQGTDVMRSAPPVLEGASVLVEFHIPIPPTVPDIDFIVQHPDPLPKPPPTQTEPELAFEHELLVPPIDWLQQLPDPIQELRRTPTEPVAPELTEVPPPPVVFGWWIQQPDPVRSEGRRQDWYVLGEVPVEIPVETWLQPPSQPVLPRPPRQDCYAQDPTIPEVLLDEWWQPASQPVRLPIQLVRFHGELFLVEFAVPILPSIPFVFVFRECQALWEIIHPQFWESAVTPSGYIPPPEYVPAPSGYIAVEDGTAPWDMVR